MGTVEDNTGTLNDDNVDDISEYEDCIGWQESIRKEEEQQTK